VEVEVKDNATKGTLLFLTHCTLQTSNLYIVKLIYDNNAGMDIWQLSFARALASLVFIAVVLNVNIKRDLYDSLDSSQTWSLLFRAV